MVLLIMYSSRCSRVTLNGIRTAMLSFRTCRPNRIQHLSSIRHTSTSHSPCHPLSSLSAIPSTTHHTLAPLPPNQPLHALQQRDTLSAKAPPAAAPRPRHDAAVALPPLRPLHALPRPPLRLLPPPLRRAARRRERVRPRTARPRVRLVLLLRRRRRWPRWVWVGWAGVQQREAVGVRLQRGRLVDDVGLRCGSGWRVWLLLLLLLFTRKPRFQLRELLLRFGFVHQRRFDLGHFVAVRARWQVFGPDGEAAGVACTLLLFAAVVLLC